MQNALTGNGWRSGAIVGGLAGLGSTGLEFILLGDTLLDCPDALVPVHFALLGGLFGVAVGWFGNARLGLSRVWAIGLTLMSPVLYWGAVIAAIRLVVLVESSLLDVNDRTMVTLIGCIGGLIGGAGLWLWLLPFLPGPGRIRAVITGILLAGIAGGAVLLVAGPDPAEVGFATFFTLHAIWQGLFCALLAHFARSA